MAQITGKSGVDQPETFRNAALWYMTLAAVGVTGVVCLLILIRWWSGFFSQSGGNFTTIPMAPLTATMFLLIGAALLIEHRRQISRYFSMVTRAIAVSVFLLSLLLLAQFLGVVNTDIETLLTKATISQTGFTLGRMSPVTAVLLALISVPLYISTLRGDASRRLTLLGDVLSLCVYIASLVIISGYWYQAPLFYGGSIIPVARLTGLCLWLVSMGQLFNRRENLFYRILVSSSLTARLSRAIIPTMVAVIFVAGFLEERIERVSRPELYPALAVGSGLAVSLITAAVVYLASRRTEREMTRKETERLKAEEKYRVILDTLLEGCQIISPDWRYLYVNDSAAKQGHRKKDELIGRRIMEVYPGIENSEMFANLRNCMETRFSHRMEISTHLDGSESWHALSMEPVEEGVFILSLDITERKKMEEALAVSAKNLRNTMETQALGCRIYDGRGNILFTNLALARMYGYDSVDELNAVPKQQRLVPKSHQESEQRLRQAFSTEGFPERYEIDILRKDGEIRSLEAFSSLMYWDGKKRTQIVYQDVTDRNRAQAALMAAAREWQTTFDSIADPISILDRDFKLIRVNRAFAELYKMDPEETIGKTCYGLMHGTTEPLAYCPYTQAIETRQSVMTDFFEPHLGRHFEVTTSPMFDDRTEVIGCVCTTRDITERKQMEEQLIVTDRLASIGQLVSGVAHELNNPLTSVIGFSELLLEKDIPDNIRRDLTIINKEALRTAGIVKGLLTFARKQETTKESLNINVIVQEVLQLRSYEQLINNIEVVTDFAGNLPGIVGSGPQLQQVFINIIINAEQAVLEANGKGRLTITSKMAGDFVRVSVNDDGPGITPDHMRRLFTPFFTTKEVGKGTGLGLSICHGIVKEHGGRVYAESAAGKGATFIVELPVYKTGNGNA